MKLSIPPKVQKAYKKAVDFQKKAYCPYSNYKVGASVISHRGTIFSGCNVENSSYGATICAERVAIFKSVSEGHVCLDHVVVVTQDLKPSPPCASCLQVMAEFCGPQTTVWLANQSRIVEKLPFKKLLPRPFGPRKFRVK